MIPMGMVIEIGVKRLLPCIEDKIIMSIHIFISCMWKTDVTIGRERLIKLAFSQQMPKR